MMEMLQGGQKKLLLSEKGRKGDEFHLVVLPRVNLKDLSEPG